jgi:hypothetical protein
MPRVPPGTKNSIPMGEKGPLKGTGESMPKNDKHTMAPDTTYMKTPGKVAADRAKEVAAADKERGNITPSRETYKQK